ncbi:MAG TPA: hypothetical protein VEO01_22880 [Pseudonocardiaceae bacterium]|nr:hypothetical protein [Pseudonocardiaceae bacterium]
MTAVRQRAKPARPDTSRPDPVGTPTVRLEVWLTEAEAIALRDGAITCTSPDPRRHQAGRRALLAIRDVLERHMPRRPIV